LLSASDFEVIQLGWNPPPTGTAALNSVSVSPSTVVGGNNATGTVTLTAAAPTGGALVALTSASAAATVPAGVTVAAGATGATFNIATSVVAATTVTTIGASYDGVNNTTTFTVNPPPPPTLAALTLNPTTVVGGTPSTGTVTLSGPAPAAGIAVALTSSNTKVARVPASVTIPAGATAQTFTVTTYATRRSASPAITATYGGVTKKATLTVKRV